MATKKILTHLDLRGDLSVTGAITSTGNGTFNGGNINLNGSYPRFNMYSDDAGEDDWSLINDNGSIIFYNSTQGTYPFRLAETTGNATFAGTVTATSFSGDGSTLTNLNNAPSISEWAYYSGTKAGDDLIVILGNGSGTYIEMLDEDTTVKIKGTSAVTVSSNKLSITSDGDNVAHFIAPTTGGDSVNLTLPITTGTVALTSDITGTNSGTNTGDQDLSGYLLNTTDTLTGTLTVTGTTTVQGTGDSSFVGNVGIGTSTFSTGEKLAISDGTTQLGIYPGYKDNVATANWVTLEIPGAGGLRVWDELSVYGTISASNLSGTNTGDQDLSGYLLNTTDTLTGVLTVTSDIVADTNIYTNEDTLKIQSGGSSGTWIEIDDENDTVEASGSMKAPSFIKNGGTGSQFLKANGSVDSNTYLTSSSTQSKYLRSDATDGTTGSLGIGKTNPILKLDIKSGINNGLRISATDTTQNWRDISIRSYTSEAQADALPAGVHMFTTNPSGATGNAFSKYGGFVIQCREDGNSSFAVRVGAALAEAFFINHNGAATFITTVTATNFILSSDKRLKENIKKVDNKHINVDWKTFEMKSDEGQSRYGVIAQELEEVHPEFVRTDDKGMKSVAYIDLLIAKIAELEARLDKANI
jgi:hypothetical protein